MKVFISGPMSGMRNYNRAAFFKAQEELERKGYSVWNPAWLAYPSDTEFTKDDMHIIDFAAIRLCDAIYMLKGWKYSKGAQEEHEYAAMRGLTIMYEDECFYSFRFNLSKVPEKNAPEFDKEFAYDEAVKNRTNYQLEAIKENVKEQYNNIDKRISSFAECYTVNLTNISKEVKAIKESIGTDNLQEQLEKDFADVYEEFQNTKDQVNDINMGYIKWSSEVSQFDERIEKLEENMKELAANGGLGLSFNLMNARVSSNKRDISSLRNDIDDIHSWINAHDKMLEDQSKQMSDLGSELDDYINDYKEAYKHLDNADEALERRIKALETKLSSLLQGYNSTLNRLKAIEKRLNIKPFYEPTEDEKKDD